MRRERSPGPGSHIPAPTPARPPARPGPAHTHHARVAMHQHLCGPTASPGRAGPRGCPRLRPSIPPERRLPSPARSSAPAPTPCTPVIVAGARPPRRGRASVRGAGNAPPAPAGPRRLPTGGGGEGRPGLLRRRRTAARLRCPTGTRRSRVTPRGSPRRQHPPPRVTFPESPEGRTPRAGRGRVRGAAGPDGFALLTRAECRSLRRQPGILCPTAAAGAVPGAGTEPGDPPGALPTSARRAPEREREREERAALRDRLLPEGTGGTEGAAERQSEGKAESGRRRALLARPSGPPLCPPRVPPPLHPSLLLSAPSLRVAAWQSRVPARGAGLQL